MTKHNPEVEFVWKGLASSVILKSVDDDDDYNNGAVEGAAGGAMAMADGLIFDATWWRSGVVTPPPHEKMTKVVCMCKNGPHTQCKTFHYQILTYFQRQNDRNGGVQNSHALVARYLGPAAKPSRVFATQIAQRKPDIMWLHSSSTVFFFIPSLSISQITPPTSVSSLPYNYNTLYYK